MLTSRANNWRKSPPTGAHSWRVKERDVPQRILVLGASGYIGQHLVRTLSQQGHQIPGGGTSCRQACKAATGKRQLP
ncbi:NAD-dependent epimerase/dehydratase family protein [Escherichia coli]|nr:NAD-dependent epimerase/dehydratase family protein [Escherichia coli]